MADDNAVVAWAQEMWSRAFAMQVVAGSLSGWRLAGPDGAPIARGSPGTAVALARCLLSSASDPAGVKKRKEVSSCKDDGLKAKKRQKVSKPVEEVGGPEALAGRKNTREGEQDGAAASAGRRRSGSALAPASKQLIARVMEKAGEEGPSVRKRAKRSLHSDDIS